MTSIFDKLPNITLKNSKIVKRETHQIGFRADYEQLKRKKLVTEVILPKVSLEGQDFRNTWDKMRNDIYSFHGILSL